MKVLKITAGKAEPIEMKHTLGAMQDLVGGSIEVVYPFDDEVALVCNEEGKIDNLPVSIALATEEGVYDAIAGTCFLCGLGEEDFIGLSEDLIRKYMQLINESITGIVIKNKLIPLIYISD